MCRSSASKHGFGMIVVVRRQRARMRVEREGAERAGEPRELHVQSLGVHALGLQVVAQRGHARVNRVQQPEARDFLLRELVGRSAPAARDRVGLGLEDLEQAVQSST